MAADLQSNAGTGDPLDAVGTVHQAPPASAIGDSTPVAALSSPEFGLSVILLVFGLIVISGQLYLATRRGPDGTPPVTAESSIRLSIVSLIIGAALVLIASGYSNDQIAPAIGLFGTIAGYLVGKQDRTGGS